MTNLSQSGSFSRNRTYLISYSVSQSVSYFTVPPRAHPSTGGSQSGSAAPGLRLSVSQSRYFTVPNLLDFIPV